MEGLKTQESDKFNKFFALIQAAAKEKNSVFFADAGDGKDFETPELEGENMMGWLVPTDKASEFEQVWEKDNVDDTWTDFFVWAIWERHGESIKVHFEE